MRRVCENGLWGGVDKDGNPVVPCRYGEFETFHYGYAWVQENGCWGLVDKDGGLPLPCVYEARQKAASNRFYWVRKNGKWGMVLREWQTAREVIPCVYDEIGILRHYRATVKQNGKWGAVDTDGTPVIPCIYDEVHDWHGRGYRVRRDDHWGIAGNDASLPCEYDVIGDLCHNRFRVKQAGKWGYGNEKGAILVPPEYEYATDFQLPWKFGSDVCAKVMRNGHWGIIDVAGHAVVPCKYEKVGFMYYNDYLPGGFFACKDGQVYEGWGKDFLTK